MKRQATEADLLMWTHLEELRRNSFGRFRTTREWKFCEDRKWRFDFALLPVSPAILSIYNIGIEIDGGVWTNGRHNRGSGYVKELEKFNMATLLGWRVLHFTPAQVLDGSAIAFIKRVLES